MHYDVFEMLPLKALIKGIAPHVILEPKPLQICGNPRRKHFHKWERATRKTCARKKSAEFVAAKSKMPKLAS